MGKAITFFVQVHYPTHDTCLTQASGGRLQNVLSDAWFWNIAPDVWCLPDASQMQCFEIRRLTQDFKTLHLTNAKRQPDTMFLNQASDARFQNHASVVIFCDHTSDELYESSYVGPTAALYSHTINTIASILGILWFFAGPLTFYNCLLWWKLSCLSLQSLNDVSMLCKGASINSTVMRVNK